MGGTTTQTEFTPESCKRIFDLIVGDKSSGSATWRYGDAELTRSGNEMRATLCTGELPLAGGEHSNYSINFIELTYTTDGAFVSSKSYSVKLQGGMTYPGAEVPGPSPAVAGQLMQTVRKA